MKLKRIALVLIISVIAIVGVGIVSAYTPIGSPAAITGQGQIPFTGPAALLDDFNSAASVNKWGGATSAFGSTSPVGTCAASYEAASGTTSNGNCLKLNYNVSVSSSYSGYSSKLGSASLASPVSYTAVSFWVKGSVGGELLKIQFSNTSTTTYTDGAKTYKRNLAVVYIPEYLDGGVTTAWQKVTIPFHNFANLDGFSSMKELVFVFENTQSTANGSVTQGTVYIDDITFENIAIPAVRIAYFGEAVGIDAGLKKGICALGGMIGTNAYNPALAPYNKYSLSAVTNEYSPNAYGMKLEYNVTTDYAYTYFIFGGGNDAVPASESGWIAVPHNFSAYSNLVIRARCATAGNPVAMKVELRDSAGTKVSSMNAFSNTIWKVWTLPLSGFAGLDKTTIKQLTFVFDASAGGAKTGIVYIDSIQFE